MIRLAPRSGDRLEVGLEFADNLPTRPGGSHDSFDIRQDRLFCSRRALPARACWLWFRQYPWKRRSGGQRWCCCWGARRHDHNSGLGPTGWRGLGPRSQAGRGHRSWGGRRRWRGWRWRGRGCWRFRQRCGRWQRLGGRQRWPNEYGRRCIGWQWGREHGLRWRDGWLRRCSAWGRGCGEFRRHLERRLHE